MGTSGQQANLESHDPVPAAQVDDPADQSALPENPSEADPAESEVIGQMENGAESTPPPFRRAPLDKSSDRNGKSNLSEAEGEEGTTMDEIDLN